MKNFYFDICAIPIYLLILITYYSRRYARSRTYRAFYLLNLICLICAVLDIAMELTVNPVPLTAGRVALGMAISFTYKLLRNSCLLVYLLFILSFTGTEFELEPRGSRILLCLPYAILVVLLVQNFFAHNVFSVTAAGGYARGPLLSVLYVVTLLYGLLGVWYCFRCRTYLDTEKWLVLLSVYVLSVVSVAVELVWPSLMVELFCSALGLLMVMLMVVRPEENMDTGVGAENQKAFQTDLRNLLLSRQRFDLYALHLEGAVERRNFFGDGQYNDYMRAILDTLHDTLEPSGEKYRLYYEQPENIYLLIRSPGESTEEQIRKAVVQAGIKSDPSFRFEPQICLIRCPLDLDEEKSVLSLCRSFSFFFGREQRFLRASELVGQRDFEQLNHIDEILERAIHGDSLRIYYQPIYDLKTGRFRSAEALARIVDKRFGVVSPTIFIPAAETAGVILPLGEAIMESVFRFLAAHDMTELGLDYVEVNLSVAQCLQKDLPEQIEGFQAAYATTPQQINFEVTESIMESIDKVMERNLERLFQMGYRFSLDDYGTGYSNLKRLRRLPISIVKIDKSMVEDMFTHDGNIIMRNTVRMMQGIHKEVVVEGVETERERDAVKDLSCDYIQGYFFSRPLPEEDFLRFMKVQNMKTHGR